MTLKFTPSERSLSDEDQLRQALRRLRLSARRIEVALDEGKGLPPPWTRAAILKASIAVFRVARWMSPPKEKAPATKSRVRKK